MTDNKAKRYSPADFLALGMEVCNYSRWKQFKPHTRNEKYRKAFGVAPKTSSDMWTALRNSTNPNIELPKDASPRHLLLAHRFLWTYDTEEDLCQFFKIGSENTVRKWIRFYIPRIQLLLKDRLGQLQDHDEGLIFMLSVDGTHCPIQEPRPFSTEWSSHKLGGKPGLNYELAITINQPRLAWVYGPTPPGKLNDISVFRKKLKHEMEQHLPGRRLVGDAGYSGEPTLISTKNEFDPPEISEFKNRVMARHETFNQRLKCFDILTKPYHHGDRIRTHGICFRAVCVHVLFEMDNGTGLLFDSYP